MTSTPSAANSARRRSTWHPLSDILRYGSRIPGQPEGTAALCCPDVDGHQRLEERRSTVAKEEPREPDAATEGTRLL